MAEINLRDLESDNPKIKYACAKQAILISKEKPLILYKDSDFFVKLLGSENHVLKWTAILVLGNLSQKDSEKKVDKILPKMLRFLTCGEMITAGNASLALAKIAKNKPQYKKKILKEFLKVEKASYYMNGKVSPECRNIAIGHIISVLGDFKEDTRNDKEIIDFLKHQTKNARPSTKQKAKKLLEKLYERK